MVIGEGAGRGGARPRRDGPGRADSGRSSHTGARGNGGGAGRGNGGGTGSSHGGGGGNANGHRGGGNGARTGGGSAERSGSAPRRDGTRPSGVAPRSNAPKR